MNLQQRLRDPSLFRTQAYVGGEWISAENGATFEVFDPATGALLAQLPNLGSRETASAIRAAEAAWGGWRALPARDRAALLERWRQLMMDNLDDLATIMTMEQGKPLVEAKGEVVYAAGFVKWFAEEAQRIYGDTIPAPTADRRIIVLKEPVGVSAAITPWNFPAAMITRKCAPALAAGCPVVVKPSDLTPLSALALAKLAADAGIPTGIFNVLTGMPEGIGKEMTGNDSVRKLSFTGSTRVGKLLMEQCASSIKRVSFELGGNAPFIVFDDADLELAVAGVMTSKFRNAGQTCVCANRIFVQEGIFDAFTDRLAAATAKLVVGNGLEPNVTLGPLINQSAVEKVWRHVEDAEAKGAVRVFGKDAVKNKLFVSPVILKNANLDMAIANEETFGPVAPLFRFKSDAEAIKLANSTPFGLASYFYTRDLRRSWHVAERLEFGMVGLNTGSVSMEVAPFGGVKQSGLGREGSKYGIEEYIESKAFHIGGLDAAADA
jgi:succinate-semialdehyde dehydrogenase/glutarate-semialdehyde dehydrogenase